MDKLTEIKKLVSELNAASDAYYNGKETLMSDTEFDLKLNHLKSLETELNIVLSNSPTINVGAPVLKTIKTITMDKKPMLSLDKVHSANEVVDFAKGKSLVASIKCDGMSTRLVYKDGKLISANSRGDGQIGSDLTEHVKHFTNIPLTIDKTGTYIVDGESIIKDAHFELVNSRLSKKNKLKNSRNAVAGTLSSLDTSVVKERMVSFITWDVIEGSACNDFHGRLYEAASLGFEVVPYEFIENANENIVETTINTMFEISKVQGIVNDGVVFRLSNIKYGDSLGHTSHHFLNAVAYKAKVSSYPTKLIDVEWTMGKTGSLCPTIITEPVEIDGSTVSKASVHNCTIFKGFGFTKGCTCYLFKANLIIPQCERVEDNKGQQFEIPSICPVCGAPTEIRKDGVAEVLYCTSDSCQGKMLGKLKGFVSKQAMDIDGLSEATLDLLMSRDYINSFKDIYHLSDYKSELSALPKMGSRSVKKLLDAIEASRKTTLDRFLVSLSIPNLGKSTSKDISNYCHGSIDEFIFIVSNTILEFMSIDGIGKTVIDSLDTWWRDNAEVVFELLEELEIEVPEEKVANANNGTDLNSATFCITGKLEHYSNRDALIAEIERFNGKYVSSVSKNTNYLINNDKMSASSKNKKAAQVGCKVITEVEFMQMCNIIN